MRGMERRQRRGMTLVEIMISLVLLGIVSGVIMRVIMRQQRFYTGVNQIITQRSQLRQATSVLPLDLRSVSSVGADILAASDSSIEFLMNVGTAIVCDTVAGSMGTKVALPPDTLADVKGEDFTTWYGYGKPNTSLYPYTVYIYNDSSVAGNEEDRWQKFSLTKVEESSSACLTGFGISISDAGKKRTVLQVSSTEPNDPVTKGPLSQYINPGAPVRVMKRVRYKLYQDASDNKWYLGFSNYVKATSDYEALSPVSGPYDPYGTTSGFGFRYYDVDGNEIAAGADSASRSRIARVDLIARARTSSNVRAAGIQGGANQQYRDSLAVSVMLRNRQ